MTLNVQSIAFENYLRDLQKIESSLKHIDTFSLSISVPAEILSICSIAYSIIKASPWKIFTSAALFGTVKIAQIGIAKYREIQQKAFDDLLSCPPEEIRQYIQNLTLRTH